MKNLIYIFLLIGVISCKKDDDNITSINRLPEATQRGANKAGCLVNGEALLPKGSGLGGPILKAFYQLIDGEYYFGISFSNNTKDNLRSISITALRVALKEVQTYALDKNMFDNKDYTGLGGQYFVGGGLIDNYYTNSTITGEFNITYLDTSKSIISGTFWFDAINDEGEIIEVREGRFDMKYSN